VFKRNDLAGVVWRKVGTLLHSQHRELRQIRNAEKRLIVKSHFPRASIGEATTIGVCQSKHLGGCSPGPAS
jgi:hypothetical protein